MNYVIHGNEPYLLKKKYHEVLKKNSIEINDLNSIFFDASSKQFKWSDVFDECHTLSLLENHKVIVITNPIFLKSGSSLDEASSKLLEQYLLHPNPEVTLIFYGEYEKLDSRKKIVKFLIKNTEYYQCNRLEQKEFESFVRQTLKKEQIDTTKEALEELLYRLPNDLCNLQHEIEKLKLVNERIDKRIIEKLIVPQMDDNVFHLVHSCLHKHRKEALRILHNLYRLNMEPIAILLILASQFRFYYQVKALLNLQYEFKEIVSYLNVHPFRVTKAIDSLYCISIDELLSGLNTLSSLDQQFKSDSSIDRYLELELFIIKYAGG